MARLRDSFLKVLHLTAVILFPLAAGILALAPDFTLVFLGRKWMPMVPAMKVLALAGLVRAVGVTTGAIFLGVGRPEINTRGQAARLLVLAILIYPFTTRWGIVGASFAVLLSILVTTIHFSMAAVRITQCPGLYFAKAIVLPLCGSGIMIWCINMLRETLTEIRSYEICLLICVGAVTYLTTMYLFHRFLGYQIKPLLKQCLASLNGQS
jgi:O-antigen/teichoic acid export membrane protein